LRNIEVREGFALWTAFAGERGENRAATREVKETGLEHPMIAKHIESGKRIEAQASNAGFPRRDRGGVFGSRWYV